MQNVNTSLTRLLAFATPDTLRADLAFARESFPDRRGDSAPLRMGLGFIGWLLDANEAQLKELIDIAVESGVQALWLAFGVDLQRWVRYIRTSPANARAPHKPLIYVQATSLAEALVAANEWKVDVIIAQGNEAGGHGGRAAPSTMVILAEVLAALPSEGAPPVLAAGGISNGTQAAAYLTAGAAGVVLGTRFVLTPESPYPELNKAAIQGAKASDTVRTNALDYAWNVYSWPEWIDGRGIRTGIVDDVDACVDHTTVQARHAKAAEAGEAGYMVTWCGQGVSLVTECKPAKEVVEELHTDIVRSLRRGQQLLA